MDGTPGPDLGSAYTSVHDALVGCMPEPLLWNLFWRITQSMQTMFNLRDVLESSESQFPAWEDPIGAVQGYQAGMEALA